jgi:hypothetical protein
MSIMPEFVLQSVLVKGIRTLRENPNLIDMLFRNLHQQDVVALRKFIRDNTIDIALNWPNASVKIPSVIISLKSESESQAMLGNLIQGPTNIAATDRPFPTDESSVANMGDGSLTTVGAPVPGIPVDPITATGGTSTTLTFATLPGFKFDDPFEITEGELIVVIRSGTGAGQRRKVSNIVVDENGSTVNVTMAWGTSPDNTSVFEFQHNLNLAYTGEPSKLFKKDAVLERIGAQYKPTYQVIIVGPDAEMTIFLYAMIKAIFFINQRYLHRHGMINVRMSGTDFVARPEYFPDLAYQRALIVEFDHTFDVYLEPEIVRQLQIGVYVYDEDVTDGSGVGRVVVETDLDLQ